MRRATWLRALRSGVWSNRAYRLLLSAQLVSRLGDVIYDVTLPWLVYDITGSAVSMATVAAAGMIPTIVFSLLAGLTADMRERKRVMVVSVLTQILVVGFIVFALKTSSLTVTHLTIAAFVLNACGEFYSTANFALLPQVIDSSHLASANAQIHFANNTVRLLGPGAAGILLAKFGAEGALLFDAASFFYLLVTLGAVSLPSYPSVSAKGKSFLGELLAGFRFVITVLELRYTLVIILVQNIGLSGILALIMFFARDSLHLTATEVGWVYTAVTLGHLVASGMATLRIGHCPRGSWILIGASVCAGSSLMMGFVDNWWQLAIAYGLMSGSAGFANIHLMTALQEVSPRPLLGRIRSASFLMGQITAAPSTALIGLLASSTSVSTVMLVCGLLNCSIVLVGWILPIRRWTPTLAR